MQATHGEWPSQADYIIALQDPSTAFTDPALRFGTVESDRVLDLPRPRSGQMASVYKIFDGQKTWAVRCFNFASAERAVRYSAISRFLARNVTGYTVGFEYVQNGIIVAAQPYPIVKMEWVEGELLHTYLAHHRAAPDVLGRLAAAWVALARDLHAVGLAHGDLQHGNVVVTADGAIKLIDYDGMFVPEFADDPSSECGHPNYQHPCRQPSDFGPQLDNFSAWVVYLSIVALAHDAGLWEALSFGDDCLALRRADYVRPSASAAFATLLAHADADVAKIARYVASMLSHEPLALPALENGAKVHAGRLPSFAANALHAGPYTEPYEPPGLVDAQGATRPKSRKPPRALVRAGAGALATLVGYWPVHQFGFATNQYLAVVALAWALAAILAVASRSPGRRAERRVKRWFAWHGRF